jgi:hypothetical protein
MTSPGDIRAEADALALHDRVRIPDGREGEVIGFYRRTAESALIRVQSGGCVEALLADVQPAKVSTTRRTPEGLPQKRV